MMIDVFDQMGLRVRLSFPPKRIVSLVPSQTELLADLGLENEVVGITKFCIHPPAWLEKKQRIGGTKNISIDEIVALKPDLVIGNKEENSREQIEQLEMHVPVWMSDVNSLEEATSMIEMIGTITNTTSIAQKIINEIQYQFAQIKKLNASVLYLIWKNPWMAAGKETFINDMLESAGLVNIVETERYPELTDELISESKPDFIFLSTEPYPFKQKQIQEIQLLSPGNKVILVDGEMFSWYGSRLRLSPAYFNQVLSNLIIQ